MRKIAKLLLTVLAAGVHTFDLFRDTFKSVATAPLTSPRTDETGDGTITITDTANVLTIPSAGDLHASGATSAFVDPLLLGSETLHSVGRILYGKMKGAQIRFGYSLPHHATPATVRGGVLMITNAIRYQDYTVFSEPMEAVVATVTYEIAVVQMDSGYFACIKGGAFTGWTLLAASVADRSASWTSANVYGQVVRSTIGAAADWYDIREWKLSGDWTKYQLYSETDGLWALTPANPYTGTAPSADFFYSVVWQGQIAGDVLELRFRMSDAENGWIARYAITGTTMKLIKLEANIETEINSTSIAGYPYQTGNAAYVRCHGNNILINIGGSSGALYALGSFNNTATGIGAAATGTGVMKKLRLLPLALPATFNGAPPSQAPGILSKNMFCLGDSKCVATWVYPLEDLVQETAGYGFYARPDLYGSGGATAAIIDAALAAVLAARYHVADYCLVNIGANDLSAGTNEATFKAGMTSIIGKLKVKWTGTRIYLAKPWIQGKNAEAVTMAGWIDDLVAANAGCYVGHNESGWLEGGDDGATMTSDGVHYSAAGLVEACVQWKAAMGL